MQSADSTGTGPGADLDGPGLVPGEILFADGPVAFNEGRPTTRLTVLNAADRPVQVGSHYHFAEANPDCQVEFKKFDTEGDPAKAAELLGWRPTTALNDGLKHTVAWFKSVS